MLDASHLCRNHTCRVIPCNTRGPLKAVKGKNLSGHVSFQSTFLYLILICRPIFPLWKKSTHVTTYLLNHTSPGQCALTLFSNLLNVFSSLLLLLFVAASYRFWPRNIIGQFFIKNEQGVAITVNGDRYFVHKN